MEFTEQQLNVIGALADGIVPATIDTPSATTLFVHYMFAEIASGWSPDVFQATADTLDIINNVSLNTFGLPIDQLSGSQLSIIINVVSTQTDFAPFWEPFRLLITINYYALPPAYEAIGLPGPTIDQGGLTPDGYPA